MSVEGKEDYKASMLNKSLIIFNFWLEYIDFSHTYSRNILP